ncbi:MAG: c-type cytochrome biogenesis protein CcmI [Paraglaciecola sp.]|nr:c-type cytochrome biogenesis protein CcmI [Paraglaciecola sp.]NCT47560.1 c-type cytochrome biogenesis protein CcmI [Paraglaciecola sp.]
MSAFIFGTIGLCLAAVLLAALPWLSKVLFKRGDELTNTRLIKQRLLELQSEEQQGLLSASDRLQAENELKLALLDENTSQQTSAKPLSMLLWLGVVFAIAIATVVYYRANQLPALLEWQAAVDRLPELGQRIVQKNDASITAKDLQDFSLGLRTRLQKEPNDAVGWLLLGRVWAALDRFDMATDAFEKSLAINPNSVGALQSFSQVLIMSNEEGSLLRAKRVLQHLLSIDTTNINAMGSLAIVATELGDRQLALANWQQLRSILPSDDANYAMVSQRIAELQQANISQAGPTTASTNSEVGGFVITVKLAAALQDKLPKSGTVYVFAQDPSGQVRMPAAVVKIPLSSFPQTIELTENNAMMPSYTLANLQQAKLVARISVDDNVAAAPGELQGETVAPFVAGQTSEQTILIDKELL